MKLGFKPKQYNVKVGDLILFNESNGYLIISTDDFAEYVYHAIPVITNGNNELGVIEYSAKSIEKLCSKLTTDYGNTYEVLNIKDITIYKE